MERLEKELLVSSVEWKARTLKVTHESISCKSENGYLALSLSTFEKNVSNFFYQTVYQGDSVSFPPKGLTNALVAL